VTTGVDVEDVPREELADTGKSVKGAATARRVR